MQADLRVFNYLGVYGLSAVTAITAQNSQGIQKIFPVKHDDLAVQIGAILDDTTPAASKTGMLATAGNAKEAALYAARGKLGLLVVDPVLKSSSGQDLSEGDLKREISLSLIPVCDLVTPNIDEAAELTGIEIRNLEDCREAALAMSEIGAKAVCITGGHLRGDPVDLLFDGHDFFEFIGQRLGEPGLALHGTGCFFSAAVTAHLALGLGLNEAVGSAKRLTETAINTAIKPGKGMMVPWLVEPAPSNL